MGSDAASGPLKRTPLYDEHVRLGAKMVPFAGYEMPVQYPLGVLKEHLWTREKAGLFDVSHMGQAVVVANEGGHESAARALETLVPADLIHLKPGQQRYSQLLAADGGILDDLMITRSSDPAHDGTLYLVVNAGCKDADYAHLRAHLPPSCVLSVFADRSLFAVQGPAAARVVGRHAPHVTELGFMASGEARLGGIDVAISRSGYTGEDGYEISVRNDDAVALWALLSADPDVQPIGLGARDSLRLEAGLCLYGHDIDTTTSPIEAGLQWSIQKRRRLEGGFPGVDRIQGELKDGAARMRVGIKPEGRAPAREGTEIVSLSGEKIGVITSGGFGPSVNGPVAMGYVARAHSALGTTLNLMVRGKPMPASVVALPFHPHRYKRS